MDYPGIPQFPLHGSQASEGSSSTAPQANFSNTTSQLSQHYRRPESQSMPSGRPRPLPDLPPGLAHRPDPRYPQPPALPLQTSSSAPSCALDRPQQYLAPLESRISPQYTASQTSNPYFLQSSCIRGVEDSRSGNDLHTHNGDGSPLTSMDDSGPQIVQLRPIEPYNSGAEQSNEQGPNVLSETGSWASRGGANVSNSHHTSDGMRHSFNRRSATEKREGSTVNPSQTWNSVPTVNNTARPNQGTYLQGIDYQTDLSAFFGIDESLAGPDFLEEHRSFVEDANNTNTDAYDSQNTGYPHDPVSSGSHYPSNPSALAPRNAPDSSNIPSSTMSNLTPPFDHDAHSQLAPESSNCCHECNLVFANRQNRRRHMHELHKEQFQYKCLLGRDGSACTKHVTKRNRRRHVVAFHPRESTDLPPTSTNRRPNPQTDEMLNRWFVEVLLSSAQ